MSFSVFEMQTANITSDKVAFMADQLLYGNRMRYCAVMFSLLIIPMTFIKGIGGGLDMLVITALMGFMLRNIDPIVVRVFGGTGNSPSGVVPFLLPLAMTVGFGAVFDFAIVVSAMIGCQFNFWLAILVFVLAVRVVVFRTTFPLARMLLDPNYQPARFVVQSEGLLLRRAGPAPADEAEEGQDGFRPFSGAAHTLSEPSNARQASTSHVVI